MRGNNRTDDRQTTIGAERRADHFRSLLEEMRNHEAFVPCDCGRAECLTYRIDTALCGRR
jgi:hypothetical protein